MSDTVTQKDFALFRQEMKSDFALFQESLKNELSTYFERIDKKTTEVINNRVDRVGKVVVTVVTIFILAFAGYFEYMRQALDRNNDNRVARLEHLLYIAHQDKAGKFMVDKDQQNKKRATPNLSKSKAKTK